MRFFPFLFTASSLYSELRFRVRASAHTLRTTRREGFRVRMIEGEGLAMTKGGDVTVVEILNKK